MLPSALISLFVYYQEYAISNQPIFTKFGENVARFLTFIITLSSFHVIQIRPQLLELSMFTEINIMCV